MAFETNHPNYQCSLRDLLKHLKFEQIFYRFENILNLTFFFNLLYFESSWLKEYLGKRWEIQSKHKYFSLLKFTIFV